jgi:hypothetical protein
MTLQKRCYPLPNKDEHNSHLLDHMNGCRGRNEQILEKWLERNLSVIVSSCNNDVSFL